MLPFIALDRRYRPEAVSFVWSLICLSAVVSEEGKDFTMTPHPLDEWFGGWRSFRDADRRNRRHPNAKSLARAPHRYWLGQHTKRFPGGAEEAERSVDEEVMQLLNSKMSQQIEVPPYEEPEDEDLFRELVVIHARLLHRLKGPEGVVTEMISS